MVALNDLRSWAARHDQRGGRPSRPPIQQLLGDWGGAAGAGAELVHRRFGVASVLEDLVRDVEALWFCRGPPHHITLSV